MKLYNVLSQSIEPFTPGNDAVSIYVCGITPYDTTHLGHAFTYTTFDVLIRFLEYQQRPVTYVQNVTDIDDDILRKAKSVNDDWLAVGNRWTRHFIEDLQTLNLRPPDHFPATEVIAPMIDIIERLLDKGVAYEKGGSVYFYVDDWPEFGQLSRIPKADMLAVANERGNNPDDPHKQDPLDFVLWQAHAPGEPAWDSPGDRAGPAGISNARPWRPVYSATPSTFTAAAATSSSLTTNARSPSLKRRQARNRLCAFGCIPRWFITRGKR